MSWIEFDLFDSILLLLLIFFLSFFFYFNPLLLPTPFLSLFHSFSGFYSILSNSTFSEFFYSFFPPYLSPPQILIKNHYISIHNLPRSCPTLPPSGSLNHPSYYPGLLNSSSNLCFLNAVLQALASLSPLLPYLDLLHDLSFHAQTPVATALRQTLRALNTPRDRPTVLCPYALLQALLGPASASRSTLFNSEQQDAQEALVTLIEAVESEATNLADALLAHQIAPLSCHASRHANLALARKIRRSPFRALMAHRIACATCGFASAIRHSPADHLSLTVPPKTSCLLESCLEEYTKLELLDEYVCRKCSLRSTYERLSHDLDIAQTDKHKKKKRAEGLRWRLEAVKAALEEDVEREVKGVEVDRTASLATTKQTMLARTPVALTVHLSRSTAFHRGMSFKNDCQVIYPLTLELNQLCTNGLLCSDALRPISSADPKTGMKNGIKEGIGAKKDTERFRLVAVVVHFGSHSFGHYITFRKVVDCTRNRHNQSRKKLNQDDQEEDQNQEDEEDQQERWFRISDEQVCEIEVEEVERSNPFLLMYEKVGNSSSSSSSSSEEEEEEEDDDDDDDGGGGDGDGLEGQRDKVGALEEKRKWIGRQVSWFDYLI